jgi:hypothetical protein
MPVEVRELIIKATIVKEGASEANPQSEPSGDNAVSPNEEIITACIEKILEILKDKNGR